MSGLRWLVSIVVTLTASTACGSTDSGTHSREPIRFAPKPGQVVFQVRHGPGFTVLNIALALRPTVTVYGNGDAYVTARGEESRYDWGGPLALAKGTVRPDVLRDLVRDAESSALFDGADYGTARVSDAGSATFTFRPDRAAARTVNVYALDISDDAGVTSDQRANRQALRALEQRLDDSVVNAVAWLPRRVDVTAALETEANPPTTRWPGPSLKALLAAHQRGRCAVLTGHDARKVYLTARRHPATQWTDNGTAYALVIRALLPHEFGCVN